MKNMIIALLFLTATASFNSSFSQAFQEERHYISLGYGFGNFGNSLIREAGNIADISNFTYNTVGPLFFKYEYGISRNFGIGLNVAYLAGNGSFTYQDGSNTSSVNFDRLGYNVNLRFAWHFGQHEIIDPYLALGAGYRDGSFDVTDNGTGYNFEPGIFFNLVPVGAEIALGSRFLFSENIGAYVEIGVCRAAFQIGLTSRF